VNRRELCKRVNGFLTPWSEKVPEIIVDTREKASGVIELLEQLETFEIKVEQLEVGDYVVADLCIERKTGSDFERSLEEGRLFKQLLMLRRSCRRRALILEGALPGRIPKRGAEGAIARIAAGLQIPILYTKNVSDTVMTLQRLALQLYGFTTSSFHSPARGVRTDFAFHQMYVLAGIPGIGLRRAQILIESFGSLRKVMNASREELLKVAGIGPVQAETIEKLSLFDRKRMDFERGT
jgi:ERCC4-type nuclease